MLPSRVDQGLIRLESLRREARQDAAEVGAVELRVLVHLAREKALAHRAACTSPIPSSSRAELLPEQYAAPPPPPPPPPPFFKNKNKNKNKNKKKKQNKKKTKTCIAVQEDECPWFCAHLYVLHVTADDSCPATSFFYKVADGSGGK